MKIKILKRAFISAVCLFFSTVATGEEQAALANEYEHSGQKYPPVFFVSNIDSFKFDDKLRAFQAFSDISSEAVGLPIGVRVLKGHRAKQDGTQFSSLMLSASTLGLIPVVQNTEFKVHYEVWVQGELLQTFKYQLDSTDVNNMWTMNYTSRETTPTEDQFIVDTLPQFLTELKQESEIQSVFDEYWLYFKE